MGNKHLRDLVKVALQEIESKKKERPDLVLEGWGALTSKEWGSMTKAVSFDGGRLFIQVKNAVLYSVLVQHEKIRLLAQLRQTFPHVDIQELVFRLG